MKDLKLKAVLGENKYFIPELEMPLYLVHIGTGEHALFQLQYGVEKSHGIESKGITSWMKFDEISEFMTKLSIHLDDYQDKTDLVEEFKNHNSFIKHKATVEDYREIVVVFWEGFASICDQWNSVATMLNEQKKIQKDPKKDREKFINGDSNSDE